MDKQDWYQRYVPDGVIYQRKIDGEYNGPWNYSLYINGRRIQKSLRTTSKALAGRRAAEIYESYANCPAVKMSSLESIIKEFSAHDADIVRPVYNRKREKHIRQFFEVSKLTEVFAITPEQINKYLDSRAAEGIAPKTRKNELSSIGAFCHWAKSRGYLHTNPARDVDAPKVPPMKIVYMQRPELEKALEIAAKNEIWGVFFAYYAGLRVHEIANLKWEQIHVDDNPTIEVRGKGDKIVTLPLHPELVKIIKEKITRVEGRETLFPKHTYRWWDKMLEPVRKQCPTLANRGQGWHTFRRTFGSILIQAGVGIERVSRLLRHNQISTTIKHYAHLIPEHGRNDLLNL